MGGGEPYCSFIGWCACVYGVPDRKRTPNSTNIYSFFVDNCIFISVFLCFVFFIVTSLHLRFSFAFVFEKVATALGGKTL